MRPRRAHAARGRLRDGDGQLQPGDRLHRLRHLRPPLLRAADARGRARGRSTRSRRPVPSRASSSSSAARPRWASRRSSRTRASRSSAPAPRRSTSPRTAASSVACWPRRACPRRSSARRPRGTRRRASPTSIGYPVLVRPSYVLGGRGMEIVYDDEMLADYIGRATQISPEHPVLVDRFLDDAIEIDVDALYDGDEIYLGGVMEHIEEAGIHSGDSACALPPITLGRADIERIRVSTEKIAARRRRARPHQHPVRDGRRHPLRARGQPARLAHRAVRVEGDRRAAGQGRRASDDGHEHPRPARRGRAAGRGRRGIAAAVGADRRQGGRAAVRPVPRHRHRARPGDALDRRGHGHRHAVRHRLREVAGRRLRPAARPAAARSSRSPTATSAR